MISFFPTRFGLADGPVLFLLGHVDLGLVDGLGGRFFPDAADVVGLVRYVGNIDVDEVQADFVELRGHILANRLEKTFAVLVDLLDGQGKPP